MKISQTLVSRVVPAIALFSLVLAGCSGLGVTTQDIRGEIQALDGKAVVVISDNGAVIRIEADDKLVAKARGLIGEHVQITARADNRGMVNVERLGENNHIAGVVESIGADSAVIGGRTFKVVGSTRLDGGLVPGALARLEFVKLSDGSLVATEIETDKREVQVTGAIESIKGDAVVIGGKTFKVNGFTRLDDGLAAGVPARVEFVTMPDGSMLAVEVGTDVADDRFSGKVESIGRDDVVIGGKTVKVNAATHIERGVGEGGVARVRFIKMSDNSLLATRIEVEKTQREVRMEQDLQRREQELRGREQEFRGREQELRGREQEIRGREQELRGREQELRGRAAEGEAAKGQEAEARGRVAEGEGARGQEAEAGRGGVGEVGRGGGTASGGGGDSGGGSGGGGGSSGGSGK